MRARRFSLLLLLPLVLGACTDERTTVPTAPKAAALTTSSCELEHSEELTLEEIDALIEAVTTLETSGTLNSGQANALRGHLENARRQIEAGRICAAVAQIEAYQDQVADWITDGVLTPAQGETLTWDPTPPPPLSPNIVTINAPSPAAGVYAASAAAFGPALTEVGVSGAIVLVNDGVAPTDDACQPLVGFPAGAIALVTRGDCTFTVKVANAQAAGASAVIVMNNVPGDPTNLGGTDASIVIPSVMVSQDAGATMTAGLPATGKVSARPAP